MRRRLHDLPSSAWICVEDDLKLQEFAHSAASGHTYVFGLWKCDARGIRSRLCGYNAVTVMKILVVEDARDVMSMERMKEYKEALSCTHGVFLRWKDRAG